MGYLIIGLLWCFWLEWFTSKDGEREWILRERIFHLVAWPISLSTFLIEIFKNLRQ